jgi:hypothetical protein
VRTGKSNRMSTAPDLAASHQALGTRGTRAEVRGLVMGLGHQAVCTESKHNEPERAGHSDAIQNLVRILLTCQGCKSPWPG